MTVCLFTFCFFAGLLAAAPAALAAEQAGKAAKVQGRVEALRGGQWRAMWSEDPVFVGDRIRTYADGRVQLEFVDKSTVRLAANSELEISQYLFQSTERLGFLKLWSGRLRAAVSKKIANSKSDYKLVTPTAVAGVRGTILGLEFMAPDPGNPLPPTTLVVFEGEVEFAPATGQGSGAPVVVQTNQSSSAGPEGPASEPAPATQAQLDQFASTEPGGGETFNEYADEFGAPEGGGEGQDQGGPGFGGGFGEESGSTPPAPPINQIPESRSAEKSGAEVEIRRVE